jgi:hypothetical protein
VIAATLAFAAKPAEACACGGYLPHEGEASVTEEHVLIRWDGQTEDIVMTLGVLGSSSEAAVIFPVPARAIVKLADPKVFDALRELTKPRVENVLRVFSPSYDLAGGAGAPSSVVLLERQTLGPFDVSTLAATDANALNDWLTANGYTLPPQIASGLQPYVAENWYFIAVRLTPGGSGTELTGALDPLWITFPYDKIVYPMRLSAAARHSLTVFMYVLADHRVQKPMSFGNETVHFAGWVEPAALEKDSPLAPFVPKKLFLTKIVEYIYQPETVNADYVFGFAAIDETYREVRYNYVYDVAGIPLSLLIFLIIGLTFGGGALAVGRMFRQK